MRAILINSTEKTITEVDYDGNYRSIYTHIGCDLFDLVYVDGGSMFVDDEGLLKNPQHFFMWKGMGQPLAGNALILGESDDDGESTECKLSLWDIMSQVVFMDREEVDEIVGNFDKLLEIKIVPWPDD